MDRFSRSNDSIVQRTGSGLQTFMAQVYGWMTVGLLLTAFVALYVASSEALLSMIFSSKVVFFGLIIAQLGLVFVLSGMVHKMSGAVATSLFMLYSALTGVTISSVLIIYTASSVASTFFICAAMFGALSVYGYTTKRSLTGMGSFLFMGLIGIIIASIVNIFMQSSMMSMVISYAGVLIFAGLTAYDTQKLKDMGNEINQEDKENMRRYSIMGALTLYLDFINLFLMLLRILGDRR
ncbi:Bax inhibitor-1/YccA family protein [Proteus cibarius]|jgi:FtsH-binding integral membrane protein|uniref:BAX inhibitor (BI)-1/YccA family protein n=2 Tax=Proteus TaxID=583 RepID=A0A6I6FVV8_9GAMM|nr:MULTISPECIES: Bax inhibitor-1/YccA family protein [Proteus]NBN61393.1 BAX inhibitor (BI)-1/YccA family protein [Proteus sp. G2639]RNT26751.1 Bax inhibitor-1/YccA family protein [Proteus mirabilis]AYY79941.1 Bax inhibitor-1/YccA family protein [Proteus vulgaris]KGA59886.1 inner membrane protein YbhL [Proteus vulgaris]MBG2915448.1 Bax inhibitor-1/YccA family protein [Proteus terrae subsp. cibarius]